VNVITPYELGAQAADAEVSACLMQKDLVS
jgi:hypothetical protein